MCGRFATTVAALLAAVLLAGCGKGEPVVLAAGSSGAADETPPAPAAPSFALPAGYEPASDETRRRIGKGTANIRIDDLDPDEVRPRISPKKVVGKESPGPIDTVVGRELAFGRVTSRFPCKLTQPQPALMTSRGPCTQTIDGRLAYVVARYVHGDSNSLELYGQGPAGPPNMSTWLGFSIIDAKTGAHLYAATGD